MMAKLLTCPELELDQEEAKKLSDAAQELGRHYAVSLDPKKVAIANFIGAVGVVYVPRFVLWRNRARREKHSPVEMSQPSAQEAIIRPEPVSQSAPPPPRGKVNGKAADSTLPPSHFWPEPAADFPGLG